MNLTKLDLTLPYSSTEGEKKKNLNYEDKEKRGREEMGSGNFSLGFLAFIKICKVVLGNGLMLGFRARGKWVPNGQEFGQSQIGLPKK